MLLSFHSSSTFSIAIRKREKEEKKPQGMKKMRFIIKILLKIKLWTLRQEIKNDLKKLKQEAIEKADQVKWKEYIECNNKEYLEKEARRRLEIKIGEWKNEKKGNY